MRLVGANGIGRQQPGKSGHLSRRDAGLGKRHARTLKVGDHLVDQQVCDRLGLLASHTGSGSLKELGKLRVAGNLLGVRRLNAKVGLKTGALGIGQLGDLASAAVDELVVQIERRQVGIGEQTIVVGRLLHTHDHGALAAGLPVAGLLIDDAALLEHLSLTANLVGKAIVQALKRVEVLELGLGAQLGLAAATQRHVTVAAHGTLLHGAIGNAQRHKDATELFHKQARFLGRAQIGLSHELNQRRAAAVVIDERLGRGGNAALGAAHVHHLGGVLLHMDAQDANGHRVGTVLAALGHLQVGRIIAGQVAGTLIALAHGRRHGCGQALGVGRGARQALGLGLTKRAVGALGGTATGHVQIQVTVHGKGNRTLRGLEVLGHIGIEVVLAVEHRVALDLAVGGETGLDDALDGALVGHRQGAGQSQAHRAHIGVGLVIVAEFAVAEHLGIECGELGMDLQADHGLPILQDLGKLLHYSSPPFPAKSGATESAGAPVAASAKPRSRARANMSS